MEPQELLFADFYESSIIGKILSQEVNNAIGLPIANEVFSRYPKIYLYYTICLCIIMNLCCYICYGAKILFFAPKWLPVYYTTHVWKFIIETEENVGKNEEKVMAENILFYAQCVCFLMLDIFSVH